MKIITETQESFTEEKEEGSKKPTLQFKVHMIEPISSPKIRNQDEPFKRSDTVLSNP